MGEVIGLTVVVDWFCMRSDGDGDWGPTIGGGDEACIGCRDWKIRISLCGRVRWAGGGPPVIEEEDDEDEEEGEEMLLPIGVGV